MATTPSGSGEDSPTFTMAKTEAGIIMGTAPYMSPEQAAGKTADRRSDVWSFGVVLYEMLTGKRLFHGETVSYTLADVLRAEIDFKKLPPNAPPAIRELLKRCLDRDIKTRLQAIGEARIAIQKYLANPAGDGEGPVRPCTARVEPERRDRQFEGPVGSGSGGAEGSAGVHGHAELGVGAEAVMQGRIR